MATKWSTTEQGLRVGIRVTQSPSSIDKNTTSVEQTWRFYVGSVNTGWADTQTLTVSGDISRTVEYYLDTPYGSTTSRLIATSKVTVPVVYGSVRTRSVTARVSGAWNGASPSVSRTERVGPRPASKPGRPGRPSVSDITNTGVHVTWSAAAANGSAIQDYQVRVMRGGSTVQVENTGTVRNHTFSGLKANTRYEVRVRAKNSAGWGDYSTARSFTTEAGVWVKVDGTWRKATIYVKSASKGWTQGRPWVKASGTWR